MVENLDININEDDLGKPFFRSDYEINELNARNFKQIADNKKGNRIAFIDGGNQEIIRAPNFSIQINRIFYNIFNGKENEKQTKLNMGFEFFSLTYSLIEKNKLKFKTSLFPLKEEHRQFLPNEKDLCFSSTDKTMVMGIQRADISVVASVARKFSELNFASEVVKKELTNNNIVVLDRILQTPYTNEPIYIKKLQHYAQKNNVHLLGLSKSCELHTTTGISLLGAIAKLAKNKKINGMWYYPVAAISSNDHKAMILIVKLHPMAKRIFRLEIFFEKPNLEIKIPEEVLSNLALNSTDLSFPGYPYGLIKVDALARVRNREMERYRLLFLSEIAKQKKWEKVSKYIYASDAHDILNAMW
ncbi:MAG: DNA double-strand break repair nuclease NurA [Candidatus Heimdallarchaeota archaeon]|nr:DNA double-strand break repair nuclease NurA [Candidatus Heimdallarchaeota archaeon]